LFPEPQTRPDHREEALEERGIRSGLPGSPRVTARGVLFFGNVTVAARVTAIPHFLHGRDPGAVSGFRTYLEVLEGSGVRLHLAAFKRKALTCPHCGREIERWEEKETAVSLGLTAVEFLHLRACDTLVIVFGDTEWGRRRA
jgi:hypothetical protein